MGFSICIEIRGQNCRANNQPPIHRRPEPPTPTQHGLDAIKDPSAPERAPRALPDPVLTEPPFPSQEELDRLKDGSYHKPRRGAA